MQEQETIKSIPSDRLQFFPIMMFAIIMGLAGLSLVYKRINEVLYFPSFIATFMAILTTVLFFVILYFYILKLIKHKNEVKKEYTPEMWVYVITPLFIGISLKKNVE